MKRIIRLETGHYLELDSYRRSFLRHMRLQLSPTTAIFAAFTFILALTYAFAAPYTSPDAPSYQPVSKTEGRSVPIR